MKVGREHGERDRKLAEIIGNRRRQEGRAEFFRIEQYRIAETCREQRGERARARSDQAGKGLGAVVCHRNRMAAHRPAGHSGRIGSGNGGADRGSGERNRLQAHLVERLDRDDLGEPARAPGAERERDGLLGFDRA
jgi:hypothetical protein